MRKGGERKVHGERAKAGFATLSTDAGNAVPRPMGQRRALDGSGVGRALETRCPKGFGPARGAPAKPLL